MKKWDLYEGAIDRSPFFYYDNLNLRLSELAHETLEMILKKDKNLNAFRVISSISWASNYNVIGAVIARRILPKQSPAWGAHLPLRWDRSREIAAPPKTRLAMTAPVLQPHWQPLAGDCHAANNAARNDSTCSAATLATPRGRLPRRQRRGSQ
ncbi:MAG: hypothetical protein KDI38_22205 [Calditrichaeota bacterium]|nr:hypothetical protein [Calditrichota bacterium]